MAFGKAGLALQVRRGRLAVDTLVVVATAEGAVVADNVRAMGE